MRREVGVVVWGVGGSRGGRYFVSLFSLRFKEKKRKTPHLFFFFF